MTSGTNTKITSLARNPLNPSTAHQSPPHSTMSTLNPSTAHQSPPHSAASTLNPSAAHRPSSHLVSISISTPLLIRTTLQSQLIQEKILNPLIYSRERPFNVIGPQRPRPIYTWPLCDHQSQMSQTCDLLIWTNKYK